MAAKLNQTLWRDACPHGIWLGLRQVWSMRLPCSSLPRGAWWALCFSLTACSPTHDWREIRPEGAAISALFPCKPQQFERQVRLHDALLSVRMASCEVSKHVFALSLISIPPGDTPAGLMQSLQKATFKNLEPAFLFEQKQAIKGFPADVVFSRWHLKSHPSAPVQAEMQTLIFTDGVTVFHASLVGSITDKDVADFFFSGFSTKATWQPKPPLDEMKVFRQERMLHQSEMF